MSEYDTIIHHLGSVCKEKGVSVQRLGRLRRFCRKGDNRFGIEPGFDVREDFVAGVLADDDVVVAIVGAVAVDFSEDPHLLSGRFQTIMDDGDEAGFGEIIELSDDLEDGDSNVFDVVGIVDGVVIAGETSASDVLQ